jgi:predicted enzyme related to lactoylglutathione lyase
LFRTITFVKSAAVVYVNDLNRMEAFYRACFRMDMIDGAADYCVIESELTTLSLVTVPEHVAANLVLSVPPVRREGVPIKLVFTVPSIDAIRPLVAELGGVLDPPETRWEFRGTLHCDGVDPEGNVLQLVQAVTPGIPETDL